MKKSTPLFIAVLCFLSAPAYSSSLKDETFVVETSESDATDSLNRVAGTIDKGFISEEYSYHSVHHGRSNMPATHEDAYDVSSKY